MPQLLGESEVRQGDYDVAQYNAERDSPSVIFLYLQVSMKPVLGIVPCIQLTYPK